MQERAAIARTYPDAAELFAAAPPADGAAGEAAGGAAPAAGGEAAEAGPPADALAWLAAQTEGFSGSDLVQLCSQAAAVPIQEKIAAE